MEDEEKVHIDKKKLKKHPREKYNFLSHLLFCWQLPVIKDGWKQKSSQEIFWKPLHQYESGQLGDKLEQLWQRENFQKNPSLTRALFKLFGRTFICYGILLIPTELSFLLTQTFFLKKLLDFYAPNQTTIDVHQAYIYASEMIVVLLCRVVVYHWVLMELGILGMKVRIACSSLIYRKALKLKQSTLDKVTIGHILNLLSNDVKTFDESLIFMHWLWLTPLSLLLGSYCLYFMFGLPAIIGTFGIIIFAIIQILLTRKFSSVRSEAAPRTDYRIQLMNDIIRSIHSIKVYAWEKPFRELVDSARKYISTTMFITWCSRTRREAINDKICSEMQKISAANYFDLTIFTINFYSGKISLFLSTLPVILSKQVLTSQYFFCLSCVYALYQSNMVYLFEDCACSLAAITVSIRRIQEYLLSETQLTSTNTGATRYRIQKFDQVLQKRHPGINITNVTVKWNQSSKVVLSDVNFKASAQDLVGVIGSAGSGKSALLYTILAEVEVLKGNVKVEGTISYASQEPWIFSASVKQNILLGNIFDSDKYKKVIEVCDLERDLSLFAHGDQTLVGERGVMLSGGQKSRINLARAVYRDADIYLFDDPLSAVDVRVAEQIFNECICGYLKKKCVILVTHQVQFLQNVDKLYVVESGRIVKRTNELSEKLGTFLEELKVKTPIDNVVLSNRHKIQAEIREDEGFDSVTSSDYKGYIKVVGHYSLACLTLVLLVIMQVLINTIDYFMSFWVDLEQNVIQLSPHVLEFFTTYHCLYIYVFLLVLLVLVAHTTSLLFCHCCRKVSEKLHSKMLLSVFNGTLKFFNQHSSGRILNRFTSDMGTIDQTIPYIFFEQTICFLMVSGTVLLIICSNYWMSIFTLVFLVVIVLWSKVFQHVNQNIKRAEGITRSVLFTHLSSSVQGLPTIRALGVQKKITEEFDRHQNFHSTTLYVSRGLFSAFGFWIDVICVVYNALVIFAFFFLTFVPSIGIVGLAISISSTLIEQVQFAMKSWSRFQGNMVSVKRVLQYTDLQPEPDESSTDDLPESWPNHGNVSFRSVSLQYLPEGPFVLKNVSFEVKSGEKIGIVGRTGAGKTSLSSVLFRLFAFDGTVLIDGVDTKSIPLNRLRSKIAIIPQEPFLLLGTLRKNIDPFNEYRDDEIWRCLEKTRLKEMVSKFEGGLDGMVSEKGSNFSVGEKQLLCLVRVMLKNNKIVVLDEATANVDSKTDELIQATVKTKFNNCTVLTIAHRLNTIMNSDKIIVMNDGSVAEFGCPDDLLQNPESFFYRYVNIERTKSAIS